MKNETGQKLVAALLAASGALLRESERLFRPHGLTSAQFNVLNVIALGGESLSQREISDRLVVDRSNVTGLVDRMEKAGWVRRADHPVDRRAYRVVFTPAGRKLWETVIPAYAAAVNHLTRDLTERRMRETLAVLRQFEQDAAAWQSPVA